MPKEEWGTKRVCPTTGKRFYDLNKTPIVSPYTGEVVNLDSGKASRVMVADKADKDAKEDDLIDDDDVVLEDDDDDAGDVDLGDDVLEDDDDDDDVSLDDIADLEGAFAGILAELREQYVLGCYPSVDRGDGQWHDVKVRVGRSGVVVRAREGYIDY